MNLSNADIQHIFQQLRGGTVPLRGLDAFAVGIERQRNEIHRLLDLAGQGEGVVKFLRGGYGCGKTFMSRLAMQEAQARGYATSFVVVSDNEFHFYKFSEIYQKILAELSTPTCPRGALGDILDRWIAHLEDSLLALGHDDSDEGFDALVHDRITEEIARLTDGRAPNDFVRVVQAFFEAKQAGEFAEAGSLLSWLSGSTNVAHSAKSRAQVKGEVGDKAALDYLRGVLELTKEAGYKGMVVVVDEAETILRMRKDVRGKSLNGIRQIVDAAQSYPGLVWIFTGTPEFYDSRRGVAGLEALHDRIKFREEAGFASARQPQLELRPFDETRLREVALRLRELYQTGAGVQVDARITDSFIDALVAKVTSNFGGDVGVVPRQFLRSFVDHLDRVDEFDDYDPARGAGLGLELEGLSEEERAVREGRSGGAGEGGDDGEELVPVEDVW